MFGVSRFAPILDDFLCSQFVVLHLSWRTEDSSDHAGVQERFNVMRQEAFNLRNLYRRMLELGSVHT